MEYSNKPILTVVLSGTDHFHVYLLPGDCSPLSGDHFHAYLFPYMLGIFNNSMSVHWISGDR